MDDFRTILRRTRSKLSVVQPMDSFPFISGDAYRLRCDVDLSNSPERVGKLLNTLDPFKELSIFVGGENEGYKLLQYLTGKNLRTSWNLFFHNRDVAPSNHHLCKLVKRVNKVFSQGWIGRHESICAIPSGLENYSKLRNGVPGDYLREIKKNVESERAISVFISFKVSNNLPERNHLRKLFSKIEGSYAPKEPINPKRYRKALLNSKYVISPPGNGPDCHRTWESIYLGATPVVLRKFWPFAQDNLPVLVVDEWSDAIDVIELESKFEKASFNNWNSYKLWDKYVAQYL